MSQSQRHHLVDSCVAGPGAVDSQGRRAWPRARARVGRDRLCAGSALRGRSAMRDRLCAREGKVEDPEGEKNSQARRINLPAREGRGIIYPREKGEKSQYPREKGELQRREKEG